MPKVICVCVIVVGALSEVCQAQSAASLQTATQLKAKESSATPRVSVTVSENPSETDRTAKVPKPSEASKPRRSIAVVVKQRKITTPLQAAFDAPPAISAVEQRPDCPFCPNTTTANQHRFILGFTATWCGPCREAEPMLKRLEAQGYRIQRVNVYSNPEVARRFQVQAIPAFVLIEKGKEVGRVVGCTTERRLKQLVAGVAVDQDKAPPRRAPDKTASAGRVQIICDRVEFEFDPHTKIQTLRCLGGVTMRSDKFEARAAQVTMRDGKLLFEGKVNFTIKQRTNDSIGRQRTPPLASTGVSLPQIRNESSRPNRAPAKAPSTGTSAARGR